jgi:hypothetical protein
MQDFCSPQNFIDWSLISLIGMALQRKVYLGSDKKRLHANMFIIPCGPPGVGKGMVLGEVSNIIYHQELKKMPDLHKNDEEDKSQLNGKSIDTIHNLLIPMAPNSTTFESLTQTLAKATRGTRYIENKVTRVEIQASIAFLLEELGSLFRKNTDDIHTLLCETYDCKEFYEYRTKNQGTDSIRKPCVNLLAGTTPDFLRRVFSSSLLTEGFASRTVFVVAMSNRFRKYETPTFCKEQIEEHGLLVKHIKELTKLQGLVTFTPEALEYNKFWFEKEYMQKLPNTSPKLIPYYARINITHAKVAMAMHFMENLSMTVSLETCQKALRFLQETEKKMHLALNLENKNPLSEATDAVLKYIYVNRCVARRELLTLFWDMMPKPYEDLDNILKFLEESEQIKKADRPGHYEPKEKEEI